MLERARAAVAAKRDLISYAIAVWCFAIADVAGMGPSKLSSPGRGPLGGPYPIFASVRTYSSIGDKKHPEHILGLGCEAGAHTVNISNAFKWAAR